MEGFETLQVATRSVKVPLCKISWCCSNYKCCSNLWNVGRFFKKLRKIAANFVKILKYSIKSHNIPRVYHLKCDLYFVQILVICCNCMGCSSCMDCNNCMYCGNFKILAISWLCWMKFCVCILRHSIYPKRANFA